MTEKTLDDLPERARAFVEMRLRELEEMFWNEFGNESEERARKTLRKRLKRGVKKSIFVTSRKGSKALAKQATGARRRRSWWRRSR